MNKRILYSSAIWTNTIALILFVSGIAYQKYHDYNEQIEKNDRLTYLIGAEAQRNFISLTPLNDQYIKLRDYQRCVNLDRINEDEASYIISSAYAIKTDVYLTLLDKFMFLSSNDLKFIMMYYSNILNFKNFAHSMDDIIKSKGFSSISDDNRNRLLRQYCVQSQTIEEVMGRFLANPKN